MVLELIKPVWRRVFDAGGTFEGDTTKAEPTAPKISTPAPVTDAQTVLVATKVAAPAAPTAKPVQRKGIAVAVLAAIALGGLAWWQPWAARVPLVGIEIVTTGPVSRVLAVNGRVAALHSVGVRSSVPGLLTEVLVTSGDTVQAGAVIARLDASQPRA